MWIKDDQITMKIEEKYLQVKKSLNIEEGEDGLLQTTLCTISVNGLIEHIVWDAHKRVKHLFTRQTLAGIRENYLIGNRKSYVKGILGKCTRCKRFNWRSYSFPDPSNLPSIRLRDDRPLAE